MNRFKKMIMGVSSLTVAGLVLGACGNGSGNGNGTSDNGSTDNGDSDSGETVTLTYANWNLGTEGDANIERLMIEAFNESQDRIEVLIDENVTTDDWNGSLATAASAGNLPDVFMLNNIPTSYTNEWLYDLSEIAQADEEFQMIPEASSNAASVGDQVVSIPFATHLFGYYVNYDILNDLNLSIPQYGFTVDELLDLVRSSTNIDQEIVGIENAAQIVDWYPGAVNPESGWFTFNEAEGTFSLDSDEMAQGVNIARDLASNDYAYVNLPEEVKEQLSGDDSGLAFRNGQITFSYNGTWMNSAMLTEVDFEWNFLGLPEGRNAIVNDFLGVSQSTEYPEEAYEFAKFMSFGTEGFSERIRLTEENDFAFNTLPITTAPEVLDEYWALVDIPGLQEAYENLDNAMVEPFKHVPGFAQARFEAPTGISIGDEDNANVGHLINESIAGNVNYQDYASQLQDLAQQAHDSAAEAMGSSED